MDGSLIIVFNYGERGSNALRGSMVPLGNWEWEDGIRNENGRLHLELEWDVPFEVEWLVRFRMRMVAFRVEWSVAFRMRMPGPI